MNFSVLRGRLRATQVAPVLLMATAAGFMATGSYSSEPGETTRYLCRDGERFAVEYLGNHVRLRTGSGIFALAAESAGDAQRYSDGHTVFHFNGNEASLERPGVAATDGCKAQVKST